MEAYKNTSLTGRLGIYLASAVGTKLDDFTGGTVLPSASSYCQGKS